MEENKDGGAMPEQVDSVTVEEPKSPEGVSYDTHRRLLNEKKKAAKRAADLEAELSSIKEAKLQEQGKYKEMYEAKCQELDSARGELDGIVSAAKRGAIKQTFEAELTKAGVVNNTKEVTELIMKSVDVGGFYISDTGEIDAKQVDFEIKKYKESIPQLFSKKIESPKTGVPSDYSVGADPSKPDFSKMTVEELKQYGLRHGIR